MADLFLPYRMATEAAGSILLVIPTHTARVVSSWYEITSIHYDQVPELRDMHTSTLRDKRRPAGGVTAEVLDSHMADRGSSARPSSFNTRTGECTHVPKILRRMEKGLRWGHPPQGIISHFPSQSSTYTLWQKPLKTANNIIFSSSSLCWQL